MITVTAVRRQLVNVSRFFFLQDSAVSTLRSDRQSQDNLSNDPDISSQERSTEDLISSDETSEANEQVSAGAPYRWLFFTMVLGVCI